MLDFDAIYLEACARKGGEQALAEAMPEVANHDTLTRRPDAFYLSTLCLRVFSAGLSHAMVRKKWPDFEQVFFNFDPQKVRLMSDEQLQTCMGDRRLIRHWGKIKSIPVNAQMVYELSQENQGVGRFLADWPTANIVSLWRTMAENGAQLGGQSTPYFLRMVGKDTFLLTTHVVRGLVSLGLVEKTPKGKKSLDQVQSIFNQWHADTGRPLSHLSRILAITVDD